MPLIYVQRYVVSGGPPFPSGTGLQTGDVLTLPTGSPASVEVVFNPALWTGVSAGTPYTIFSFNSITGDVSSLFADATVLGFTTASFTQPSPTTIAVTFS